MDDERAYAEASAVARATADRWYSEPTMRRRYLDYFDSLRPGNPLFEEPYAAGSVVSREACASDQSLQQR